MSGKQLNYSGDVLTYQDKELAREMTLTNHVTFELTHDKPQ